MEGWHKGAVLYWQVCSQCSVACSVAQFRVNDARPRSWTTCCLDLSILLFCCWQLGSLCPMHNSTQMVEFMHHLFSLLLPIARLLYSAADLKWAYFKTAAE